MLKLGEMKHQTQSLKFMGPIKRVFDASDPGTGKTYVQIKDFARQHKKDKKAMMVFCPKSLMKAAWADDIKKFAPHLTVSLCYAHNRAEALKAPADVYVINIDGVKDLLKFDKRFWSKFGRIVIDESTTVKHATSQRSKAMAKIVKHFEWRRLLSGTPAPNGICDLWHQYFLLDDGKRLGKSFYAFRAACCIPTQTGPQAQHLAWTDRDGIALMVGELVSDITIRHVFEECVDIPPNHKYSVKCELSPKHRKVYEKLESESFAEIERVGVTAVNGAVLAQKLLQVASGAVYNDDGDYSLVDTDRYDLVCDLIEGRKHSVCFYLWNHQLDELTKLCDKREISYVVWNPDTPEIKDDFQAGMYQVLFAHPQSAGHGLTLTKGTATIWPSPTHNLEHFIQGLKRVYRLTQTQPTETIVIVAENTYDEIAYENMVGKGRRQDEVLLEFASVRK